MRRKKKKVGKRNGNQTDEKWKKKEGKIRMKKRSEG